MLPKHDRLASQIVGLERRVSRAGKDSIDHAPHGHDDLANCACRRGGALQVRRLRHEHALGVGRRRQRRHVGARPSPNLHQQRGVHPTMADFCAPLTLRSPIRKVLEA